MKIIHVLRVVGSLGFIRNGVWIKPPNSDNYVGGTQIQSHMLTWGLNKLGVKHTVLTRSVPKIFANNKTVTIKSCGKRGEFFFPLIAIIESINDNADIIHVHMGISSYIPIAGLLIAKLKRKPLVCTLNLSWQTISGYSKFRQVFCLAIEKFILWNADRVIYLQPNLSRLNLKATYIPDAIEQIFFSVKCNTFKERYFLFVGRVSYQKGIDILLDAFKKSKLSDKNYQLILIVDSKKQLPNLLPKGVEIKVNISRSEIASLMANSTALVVPSRFEERGTVIGEALAAGTPVIASNLDNIQNAYVQAPINAISYYHNGSEELSKQLVKITKSEEIKAINVHALRKFAMNFKEEVICKQHMKLYQDLVTMD